jgi:hypothetical protein
VRAPEPRKIVLAAPKCPHDCRSFRKQTQCQVMDTWIRRTGEGTSLSSAAIHTVEIKWEFRGTALVFVGGLDRESPLCAAFATLCLSSCRRRMPGPAW